MQLFGIFTSYENKWCYLPSGNNIKDSLFIAWWGFTMLQGFLKLFSKSIDLGWFNVSGCCWRMELYEMVCKILIPVLYSSEAEIVERSWRVWWWQVQSRGQSRWFLFLQHFLIKIIKYQGRDQRPGTRSHFNQPQEDLLYTIELQSQPTS